MLVWVDGRVDLEGRRCLRVRGRRSVRWLMMVVGKLEIEAAAGIGKWKLSWLLFDVHRDCRLELIEVWNSNLGICDSSQARGGNPTFIGEVLVLES